MICPILMALRAIYFQAILLRDPVYIYNVKINVGNLVLVLEDLLREETEPPVREAGEELGDVDPPRVQLGVLELVPGLLVGGAHQTRDVALVLDTAV